MPGSERPARPGRLRRLLAGEARPQVAAVLAVLAVAAVAVALALVHEQLSRSTQALLLVLPVVVAAVLGGRWPGYAAAAAATVAFSLYLPPVGSVRVAVAQDVVALCVFLAVAVVISELVSARIAAVRAVDRQRAALLRSVSHDLRTPLAAVRAAATELLDDPDGTRHDAATRRRLLELVDTEADRLDRMVADVLDMSRLEAGALLPRREPVDLADLARAEAARWATRAPATPVEVRVDDGLPPVPLDPTLTRQVLSNLIDNAVRHSPPGGRVHVALARDGHRARLAVDDEGPGIPPDRRRDVFDPFTSGRTPGAGGLGLAICDGVVRAHGGTIRVDDGPHGGARFTVWFPLR